MKKIILLFVLLNGMCINAAIVVRDIPDTVVMMGTPVDFDFNNDGTTEFSFMVMSSVGSSFDSSKVNFITFGTVEMGGWDVIRPLSYGTSIGVDGTFGAVIDAYINPGWASPDQMFADGDSYVGTKFKIGANTYYGWILVNLASDEIMGDIVTVKSYAYNDVPEGSIAAGDTGTLSVTDIDQRNAVAFFPNPVKDQLTLLTDIDVAKVSAFDVNGRMITLRPAENKINMDGMMPGFYFLDIVFGNGSKAIVKIIKE